MALELSWIIIWCIMRVRLLQLSLFPIHLVILTRPIDYELGRLLACMGDIDGARTQFDLVLSGRHLEVNATGRKVSDTEPTVNHCPS